MKIKAYCRKPASSSTSHRFPEGGCPQLLYDLLEELKGASEIHIAAYLFNNPIYLDYIKSFVNQGCKVYITSLPIRGYDDKPVSVKGYDKKISGREMAIKVYNEIQGVEGIDLYIFPHMYMWYGALYADKGASYSFHVKAILAKFKNEEPKCILSSGNFMFTDPPHSDSFIVIQGSEEHTQVFSRFFGDVESYSIPYSEYINLYKDAKSDFNYSFVGKEIDLDPNFVKNCFFTAPFYTIGGIGSNHYAGQRIIDVIKNAKKRIWICAQHFHDVVSFDPARRTIIDAIYNSHRENNQLDLRFLKQVAHSSLADKRRAAIAETLFQYVLNAKQRVNKLVHDKFLIVDNSLIVTTANYTSTQFAFGKRKMEMTFGKGDKQVKEDYFSEVNGFLILPNCDSNALQVYEKHFEMLWDEGNDISINL
ncbi:MAG: hypothetical protein GX024_11820 [Clostridiales bacterium]|nr:hypothetical protein [Clostridiales bacterium]